MLPVLNRQTYYCCPFFL